MLRRRRLITMGQPLLKSATLALICLLMACAQQRSDEAMVEQARIGLDTALSQMPNLPEFVTVDTIAFQFSRTEHEQTCYYARGYLVLGASLQAAQALDLYVESLRLSGWDLDTRQYETSRLLSRGNNEWMEVRFGEPGVDIEAQIDYEQIQRTYNSVIFVRLDYVLPSVGNC